LDYIYAQNKETFNFFYVDYHYNLIITMKQHLSNFLLNLIIELTSYQRPIQSDSRGDDCFFWILKNNVFSNLSLWKKKSPLIIWLFWLRKKYLISCIMKWLCKDLNTKFHSGKLLSSTWLFITLNFILLLFLICKKILFW
jgi:hypothetical protein